ncbi:MAG: VacB/RNase II family 3'-5' exoribonuclease [bacterium]
MSVRKQEILELFDSDPEKEFTLTELVEHFKITTKARKKLMPHLQSLTNTGYLYRLGYERYVSAKSVLAENARAEKAARKPDASRGEPKRGPRPAKGARPPVPGHPVKGQQVKAQQSRGQKGGKATNEFVVGRFIKNIEGFGFVSSMDSNDDVYMDKHEAMWNGVMNGDIVKVQKFYGATQRKSYGKFVEFVSRRDSHAIGKLIQQGGSFAVELRKSLEIIMIQRGRLSGARKGDWVEVEIKKWPEGRAPAYGEIVKIIDADTYIVLNEYKITEEFPEAVLKEAVQITEPSQDELQYKEKIFTDEKGLKRKNLSFFPTVTIDGKTARDFDDAVSYALQGENHLLCVSIADVSHYVILDSAIDKEAQKRTTSVYFPDRAIPMLPESLSNEVCCLKPDRYRYAMTAEMLFDKNGTVKKTSIYSSVIRSNYRLTYEQAQKIIKPDFNEADPADMDVSKIDPKVKKMVKGMFTLYSILRKNSKGRGTLFLDVPEPEVIVDEKGDIKDIKKRAVWDSHSLIEEFMIAANIQTAKKLKQTGKGVFRVHDKPDPEKLKSYSDIAKMYKVAFNPAWDDAAEISSYLEQIKKHPAHALLHKMLLRSLRKAEYSNAKDLGHFALALPDYTHFTSPIRRYPDLIVHRLLKGATYYDEKALKHLADICSQGEVNAMEAERSITRIKQARYMEDKIGQKFLAEITGLNDYGMFVQLKDVFVEGYLPFSKLGFDHFVFDPSKMAAKGKRTNVVYKLGDDIKVETVSVDIFEGKVEFAASAAI